MEETAIEVKFLTKPIPAPGGSHSRYTGGRLTYYGAVEIEPTAASVPNVSVRQNDVVQIAPAAGAVNNHGDQPFLAQVRRSCPSFLSYLFSRITLLRYRCFAFFLVSPRAKMMHVGRLRNAQAVPKTGRVTAELPRISRNEINSSDKARQRPMENWSE